MYQLGIVYQQKAIGSTVMKFGISASIVLPLFQSCSFSTQDPPEARNI